MNRNLMYQCLYAMGEAKTNTEMARAKEDRPEIEEQLTEDYLFFDDLCDKLQAEINKTRNVKNRIAAG